MYPNLTINLEKIQDNTEKVTAVCREKGIDVTAVTKCAGGNPDVARAFLEGGAAALGDSRIKNLQDLSEIPVEKWLIRIPMISEAEEAVKYADLSLNSELAVLQELNREAIRQKKKHDVILMADHGDLREGWFDENDFYQDLKEIRRLSGLNVRGLGTNSNCAGAVIPEPGSFTKLKKMYDVMQDLFGENCNMFSGGNSGAFYMVEDGTLPPFINNLRFGELLLFGNETSFEKKYPWLHSDVFRLDAEIVELKEKPSEPIGKHGKDAFGNEPVFEDIGIRKRALCALGKQDVTVEDIFPLEPGTKIVTASSDHLIVDVTDCPEPLKVGDILSFSCNYVSALRASTSDYVNKTTI
ncbi:MAG: alanine racemase [Eubacteriaceae bacterium]|jgi:predicted amino acid racemase